MQHIPNTYSSKNRALLRLHDAPRLASRRLRRLRSFGRAPKFYGWGWMRPVFAVGFNRPDPRRYDCFVHPANLQLASSIAREVSIADFMNEATGESGSCGVK